jgi:uncharacterized protein YecA (UPF0149 family)
MDDQLSEEQALARMMFFASAATMPLPRRRPVTPPPPVKAGRNAECPCGSGRKFKRCCLRK